MNARERAELLQVRLDARGGHDPLLLMRAIEDAEQRGMELAARICESFAEGAAAGIMRAAAIREAAADLDRERGGK